MKIKFIGAVGGDVTGSCILCCARNGTRFLVDCGIFQGGVVMNTKNSRFPFDPKSIDFVLLTHAHLDHCGRIPDLYKYGFTGKIICNTATRDLAILNILDMNKAQFPPNSWEMEREKWKEVFITEEQRPEIKNTMPFLIDNDLQISVLRSSHFLGAVSFSVTWNSYRDEIPHGKHRGNTICFSGDLGTVIDGEANHLPLLKDGFVPFLNTDYIVMESTYGAKMRDAEHKNFEKRINHLENLISMDGIDTHIFACFSMQRTQDILFDLLYLAMRDDKHRFEIVLDSRMGIKACEIYKNFLTKLKVDKKNGKEKFLYLNKDFVERFFPILEKLYFDNMNPEKDGEIPVTSRFIEEVLSGKFSCKNIALKFKNYNKAQSVEMQTQRQIVSEGKDNDEIKESKRIHITTSGMFQYGPILKHLKQRHGDDRTAFYITGFCKSTPNGKSISAWSEGGEEGRITLGEENGEKIGYNQWRAKINNIAPYYSGHADVSGLFRFLFYSAVYGKNGDKKSVSDKRRVTVFLNHGNTHSRAELKKKIEEKSEDKNSQNVREIKRVELPNATDPFFNLDNGEWDANPNDLLSPVFTESVEKQAVAPAALATPKFFRVVAGNLFVAPAENRKKKEKEQTQKLQYSTSHNMEEARKILQDVYIQCKDEHGWAQLGRIAIHIKTNYPNFSFKNYGYERFSLLVKGTEMFQYDDSEKTVHKIKIKD